MSDTSGPKPPGQTPGQAPGQAPGQSQGTDASGAPVAPSPRELVRRVRVNTLGGERPYVLAFVAAVGLALVVVSGPIQTLLEQRELVENREAVLAALEAENELLGDRVQDLNNPATIEAEAREEQGMVRPGEVPYVIVPPAVEDEQIAPDLSDADSEQRGWFARAWDAVTGIFG
jgi:cell division protein FtsB